MKNSGIPLSSFPLHIQEQISSQMHPQSLASSGKPRLRQDSVGQNKTERAFGDWLEVNLLMHDHFPQSITFKLANGVRYTPDWISISRATGKWISWETKGFMRDDASVKIKVAAHVYKHVSFRLVTKLSKKKGGGWDVQDMLP